MADDNEGERRLISLHEAYGSAEGKHRIRNPDSPLKSAQETLDENNVWGHKLVPSKETKFARVDRPPYHDDYEELLESYMQEILPEDTMQESVSLQDVPTITVPDSPDPTSAHGGAMLRQTQHKTYLDNHEATSKGPRRTKKQIKMSFAEGMISGRTENTVTCIDVIREQLHKRIVEQIRLEPPDMPPPPPSAVVSAELEQRRRRLQNDLDDADDLLDDLELHDEALEKVPMKEVGSGGSHRFFREEQQHSLTQSTKYSSEVVRVNEAEKAAVPKVPTKLIIPVSLQRRMELSKKANMCAASPTDSAAVAAAPAAAAAASVTPKNEGGAINSPEERSKQRRAVQRTIADLEIR